MPYKLYEAQSVCVCVCAPRYIIVVEHDLSVLDYLSDFICCLYGVPSAYGVVTMPFSVREGTVHTHEQTSPRQHFEQHCSELSTQTLALCFRNQHFSGRLRADGEPALQRDVAGV